MKREILISVSYILEADEDDFWNTNGRIYDDVKLEIEKLFPKKTELNSKQIKREKLSYIPLGNKNSKKCPLCHRWMTSKPTNFCSIRNTFTINSSQYCELCYDEVQADNKD